MVWWLWRCDGDIVVVGGGDGVVVILSDYCDTCAEQKNQKMV